MSNNIERYTTELRETALNHGRAIGNGYITGIEIDGVTLWENFHEIYKFWNSFGPVLSDNMAVLRSLRLSHEDGLITSCEPLCKSISKEYRSYWYDEDEDVDSNIEDAANCIIKDAVYHIGIKMCEYDGLKCITQVFICDDNSIWEKWYNQPVFDADKWEERYGELYQEAQDQFAKWEANNVPDELVKYTKMSYYTYERDEYHDYEEFVYMCGYVDGTRISDYNSEGLPVFGGSCEDIATYNLYEELYKYFGIKR